jgi:hypothetical protein
LSKNIIPNTIPNKEASKYDLNGIALFLLRKEIKIKPFVFFQKAGSAMALLLIPTMKTKISTGKIREIFRTYM